MENAASDPVIVLFDDGTLDTVIGCQRCGRWLVRADAEGIGDMDRDDFIAREIRDWTEWHTREECDTTDN